MEIETKALVGCGVLVAGIVAAIGYAIYQEETEPTSGTVTKIEYQRPWTQTNCTTVGKTTTCTPIHHPECYRIEYDHGDDWGDACVSPVEYQLYRIGDHYPKER